MVKSDRIDSLISPEAKKKLKAIKKKTNGKITTRYILEKFIKDYCSTEPNGLIIEKEELETDVKEAKEKVKLLEEYIIKKEMKIKIIEDKLNDVFDIYIDEDLVKAVKSISNICKDKNFETFDSIPEQTFIAVAKYHKIEMEILKQEVKKELF